MVEDLIWPNGLTLDQDNRILYWCDTYLNKIESLDIVRVEWERKTKSVTLNSLVQKLRKVLVSDKSLISRPYGLALLDNTLFWTEFTKGKIIKFDLRTNKTETLREENPQLFEIKVFSSGHQMAADPNPCENRAGCQDLCLPTRDGPVCGCRDGADLTDDGKTCRRDEDWAPPASHCGKGQFQCAGTLQCIDSQYYCDGSVDCGDGSDERTNCSMVQTLVY